MKKTLLLLTLVLAWGLSWGQAPKAVKPVKNVILMIPDGTSVGVVSAARWYQIYNKLGGDKLHIDPYMCGTVKTYSSNAPIGDSAPTTSCYMTGVLQQANNVAIYPEVDPENDLVVLDPSMTHQPLATLLEAAKYQQNKATGMVVTVEFPHATPADCSSHYYDRHIYKYIAPQIAYNNLDVMFGGGNSLITDDIKNHFKSTNTLLMQDDINGFRSFKGKEKIWALFGDGEHPYDIDRDDSKIPSLAEMTGKAIDRLSQDENGFFLMVEGSKIDWVAHGNDAVGCITEFLAFDQAVGVALDFAKKNGETAVVILPDHGNSGFTIGRHDLKNYTRATLTDLFGTVSKYKRTSEGMEKILLKTQPSEIRKVFKDYTDIDLTDDEFNTLLSSKNYKHEGDYTQVGNTKNMQSTVAGIMNARTWFGFTSNGHTGEEVFLSVYHPNGDVPMGVSSNVEINDYLYNALGLQQSLPDMTKEIFAKHTDVFKGLDCKIDSIGGFPQLEVRKGKNTLIVPAFKSVAYFNKKAVDLKSVTVYIDKNNTFYLPESLGRMFAK